MDIKEIALKLLAKEFPGMRQENQTFMVEFAEALISAYKGELLKESGEPVAYFSDEFFSINTKQNATFNAPLYTSDQLTAAILKAAEALEEEVERLKGIKNVQLDIYPNDAGTKQQREVDGSLEMGQLLADSKNEETSNPKAERAKSLVWMHTGGGHIADSSGKRIGIFSGDFKHRDRLICAVNSESDLLAKLAKAEQLWQVAQGRCDALEEKLAKAEQRVADACANYVNRFINGDGILNEVWISDIESALRNGEWRKHMKGD